MSEIVEANVPILTVICNNCQHYLKDGKCKAFPSKIPTYILKGDNNHSHPLKGQVGEFVYTPNTVANV